MSVRDEISKVSKVSKVTKVRPANGRVLRVRFAGDRRERELDLTGLIARSKHFMPLLDDAGSYRCSGEAAVEVDGRPRHRHRT